MCFNPWCNLVGRVRWPYGLRWVCGRSIAGIASSNPAGGKDVRLMCLLCVVEVAASATGRSVVQRSSIIRVCVCVCARACVCR